MKDELQKRFDELLEETNQDLNTLEQKLKDGTVTKEWLREDNERAVEKFNTLLMLLNEQVELLVKGAQDDEAKPSQSLGRTTRSLEATGEGTTTFRQKQRGRQSLS